MTKQDRAIERIMKLNRDMAKDAEFEAVLREELKAAYNRGYAAAQARYEQRREDMGR